MLEFAPQTYASLPGVESIAKVGQASEAFTSQMGLNGPPKMPQAEVKVLTAALQKATQDASFIKKAKNTGLDVIPQSPSQWKASLSASLQTLQKDKSLLESFH